MNANLNPRSELRHAIELARTHEVARERAKQLRDEAIASLWHDLSVALKGARGQASHLARRLTHRLVRLLQRRSTAAPGCRS